MDRTTQSKTMRMDVSLVKKIERMAQEQNRNFSNMVETLLKDKVREQMC